MLRSLTLIVVMLLLTGSAFAQGHQIDGTISDADDHTTMPGAIVKLIMAADSTRSTGMATDDNGKFVFPNLADDYYRLQISYVGFKTQEQRVKLAGVDKHVGTILMVRNPTTLKDVPIIAKEERVQQKNDTTEYNAKAYKVHPDATAEDLVTKMPGITSDNGTVKAHGETVQKVYVDGKEFFGDDATLALKNLPAEVIDKVQVFDKWSDQAQFTGFDDGNSQKAINIMTKSGRNNGVFGKIYAGYGYLDDSKYSAGANVNWFEGDRRISVIGMANNVNIQNFATQDLLGVIGTASQRSGSGTNGGFGGRRGGGSIGSGGYGGAAGTNNFLTGQQGGISTTYSAGLNYTDVWGKKKKVKITGSYFFNQSNNINNTDLTNQYFNDSSTYYKENNSTTSRNINHRVSLRLEYAIDSMNKLIFSPKISLQQNNQNNTIFGQTTTGLTEFAGQSQSAYHTFNFGYNLSGDILYQHKFKKPKRTLAIDISSTVNDKTGNSTLNSINKFAETTDSTILDQQATFYNRSYTVSGSLTYTEPVGKTGIIQLNYNPSNTWNTSDKETYNLDTAAQTFSLLDTTLTNKFNNIYMTHRGGITYRLSTKTMNLSFGVNAQYALLSGQEVYPVTFATNKNFFNILPSAMFTYRFSTTSSLRIFYRTSTSPPSITQLQNVIDNSNPLLLSTGNPNLKQAYSHSLILRYGLTNRVKAQSFFAFASATYTQQYVGTSTTIANRDTFLANNVILHQGSQLSQPVNLNGSLNVNSFFTYGFPIDKIKCNMNLNAGATYQRTPGLIDNLNNLSNTYNINGGFVLGSNISEKVDFTVSYSGSYNIVKNSLQTSSNNNYFNHTAGIKFNWLFYMGYVFNTSLQNTFYEGVSQGYNLDIFLWNASLGYKFFKDRSLEVKASVNDILNQNTGINRTVTDTYVQDSKTQVLKRYVMLTVTYTLRYFRKP